MSYHQFTHQEFQRFIDTLSLDFDLDRGFMTLNDLSELVYSAPVKRGFRIMIYSSISTNTSKARAKGSDAIHLEVTHSAASSNPVLRESKTLRTNNWESNLRTKIDAAVGKIENSRPCPNCGEWLVRKEGSHGEFYGCVSYPDCEYTEDI